MYPVLNHDPEKLAAIVVAAANEAAAHKFRFRAIFVFSDDAVICELVSPDGMRLHARISEREIEMNDAAGLAGLVESRVTHAMKRRPEET